MSFDSPKTDRDSAYGNIGVETASDAASTASTTMPDSTAAITNKAANEFVKMSLRGGMMEIESGSQAAANTRHPREKNFGSMMVAYHTQARNEFKQTASTNSIIGPAAMIPGY